MARHTANAIQNINNYEKRWKISTNQAKFKIIPIAKWKPDPVVINGAILPYTREGKMLGLKITTTGLKTVFKRKKIQAELTLTKLQRFRELTPSNKLKLYNALIKSSLTYPPVPLNAASPTNMKLLQIVQNKSLRFVYNVRYTDRISNETIHLGADIPPINLYLHHQAAKIWDRTENTMLESTWDWIETEQNRRHLWFPRSRPLIQQRPPNPLY